MHMRFQSPERVITIGMAQQVGGGFVLREQAGGGEQKDGD